MIPVTSSGGWRKRGGEDGESILPGLKVMLLPGHAPGTIGLYFEPEKILFTSDSVKNAWKFVRNEPPPAFYSKDAALQNYTRVRGKARIVVPGHDRHFYFDSNGRILLPPVQNQAKIIGRKPYQD
jgi:glyoxylase-like metal-dependent hydrolase (beta-lactamase superfamily II)